LLMLFNSNRKKGCPPGNKDQDRRTGDFVEITSSGAMVCDKLCALQNSFEDADVWSVERLLAWSFWRVGNGREWVAYKTN
jgi:hypothetical protein